MIYRISYSQDKRRIVPAVLIDNRGTNGLAGKTGIQIKEVTDEAVANIGASDLFYIMETDMGNLAGYFVLRVSTEPFFSVNLNVVEVRPGFNTDISAINNQITLFINSGLWKTDFLN